MTYCVGLKMNRGLVFMSDTRTNAGVDNISTFRKMFTWTDDGDTVVTLMTAGNLATTQAVISTIDERMKAPGDRAPSILGLPSMYQVARHVGQLLVDVIAERTGGGMKGESAFNATIILGGQVKGSEPRLFLIYPEGNFIEAGDDTPFLQIGETKYGRPILVRAFDPDMSFEAAVKLLLVSFDSTIKANLSVGLPLDLHIYERDSLKRGMERRVKADDAYFQTISLGWGEALKRAFDSLPDITF
ncbi:proteasome-type protease [Rhodobacter sp. Har01]|uniref:proteasome-type protease n=1 Tax=Rhodobacter sp. Har01 TaxID=2883999 RepID=UPI001D08B6DC|nr:proteasome-type protease [Rhodobacter sp. Har01]MCB6177846.1 proteasome-type protease [Rhodobacter sp. Har01]